MTHQGGFATTGKTHHTEDLAFFDIKADISYTDNTIVFRQDLGLANATGSNVFQSDKRLVAKYFPNTVDRNHECKNSRMKNTINEAIKQKHRALPGVM